MKNRQQRGFLSGYSCTCFRKCLTAFACLLFAGVTGIYAQTKTVSGTVIDETQEPLIGVSVRIHGATMGTMNTNWYDEILRLPLM
ncbi:TonB-linked outer membrane protein, SusC/RagA family [Bacteroidales bacterium Barb6XT]|nr:TonB-linked outer membrane protein, SusC/RagA family [Bacteroidales bacterium Barb6XT]